MGVLAHIISYTPKIGQILILLMESNITPLGPMQPFFSSGVDYQTLSLHLETYSNLNHSSSWNSRLGMVLQSKRRTEEG